MLDLENSDYLDYVPGSERLICTANELETMFWLQEKKNKMTGFYRFRSPF